MDAPEEELVARAVAGSEDALADLLHRYSPQIRSAVHSGFPAKWKTVLDVDDVMQITYLEAFLRIDRFVFKGPGSFAGWLTRIAQNNLRDAIREMERLKRPQPGQRVEPLSTDDSSAALLEDLGYTTTTPSRHAAQREVQLAVETALTRLPEDYASVVRLYDLEGRSATDVASSLGRSEGAVYMLRARAHDRLREVFAADSRFSLTRV